MRVMRFSYKVVNSLSEFRGLDIIFPQWILCINETSNGKIKEVVHYCNRGDQ